MRGSTGEGRAQLRQEVGRREAARSGRGAAGRGPGSQQRGLRFQRPRMPWAAAALQDVFEVRSFYSVNSDSSQHKLLRAGFLVCVMEIVIFAIGSMFVRMFPKAVGGPTYTIECQLRKSKDCLFCYQLCGAWCRKMFNEHLLNDKYTPGASKGSRASPPNGLGAFLTRKHVCLASPTAR